MSSVVWLSPGDPSQRTGGFLYNARMVKGLQDLGVDVSVVDLAGEWPWPAEPQTHEQTLAQIADHSVVVADGLLWPGLDPSIRRELCRRCSVWVVVHSLVDKEQVHGDVQTMAQREVDALKGVHGWFATSQRTADLLGERLGTAHRMVVVPGTDRVHGRARGEPRSLLSVGHLIPRKGHDALLRVLSELKELPWTLRIVGSPHRDSDYATALFTLRDELGLNGRVEFVGECDSVALEEEYRRAEVLVHAAHFEAYGMVLTEALARGLPVISSEAGALDNLNSDAVWLVRHEGLSPALRTWLCDESARERAMNAARDLVFPTWSEQVVSLRAVLGLADHGFSTDWLRMREPFDHAARSVELVEAFGSAIQDRQPRILELATGLGSGTRFVAQHLDRPCIWRLLDHDDDLLEALTAEMGERGPHVRFDTIRHDLEDVEGLPTDVDGVTTQALLDLVSTDWLRRFAGWLVDHNLPLLAAISVDGRMDWTIPDESDELVKTAFRTHQTWDRGFGPSPGVEAVSVLSTQLEAAGYSIVQTDSDWVIPPESVSMMTAMIEGIAHAAMEAAPAVSLDVTVVSRWKERRLQQLGSVGMRVGHIDVLAIPPLI